MINPELKYIDGKPCLLCDTEDGVSIKITFAEKEPEFDAKKAILDILTEQYAEKTFFVR